MNSFKQIHARILVCPSMCSSHESSTFDTCNAFSASGNEIQQIKKSVKQREKWIVSTAHGQKSPVWQRGLSQLCLAKSLRWPDITCSPPQVKKIAGSIPVASILPDFFAKAKSSARRSPSRVFCLALCCPAKAGCLFEKGAASVRGRLLVDPRCILPPLCCPAQCRFAAWAAGGTTTTSLQPSL